MPSKKLHIRLSVVLCILTVLVALAYRANAQQDDQFNIWTKRYSNKRMGVNQREVILNPKNVNTRTFGKIYQRDIVGHVYAQVLYMHDVETHLGHRNLILVATMANYVYAFDADDPDESDPIWVQQLGNSAPLSDNVLGIGPPYCYTVFTNIAIEIGILSTPVIDTDTNIMYVVAMNKDSSDPYVYHHRIYGLDVATGEIVLGPKVIEASVPGNGPDNVDGRIHFNSKDQNQRPGLLLSNGIVYVAFGSFCDTLPYVSIYTHLSVVAFDPLNKISLSFFIIAIQHGWLLGYDAKTLELKRKWNGSPNAYRVSIWMSGDAIATDENGSLYFATANGEYDPENMSYGNSIVRIDPDDVDSEGLMKVKDHYRPEPTVDRLGTASTGVTVIPGTKLIMSGSKEGWLLLQNREQMNGQDDTPFNSSKIVQIMDLSKDNMHQTPMLYMTESKNYVYTWPESCPILQLKLDINNETDGRLKIEKRGKFVLPERDMPGGMLTLSANGQDIKTGIVWASRAIGDAKDMVQPGVLHAYAASDVSKELWSSLMAGADDVGAFPKFVEPTVIAGRVFLPTQSFGMDRNTKVNVYGLFKPRIVYPPTTVDGSQTLYITATGNGPLQYRWFEVSGDGEEIPVEGGKSKSLVADPSKEYFCRVLSPYGEVQSDTVSLATARRPGQPYKSTAGRSIHESHVAQFATLAAVALSILLLI